MFVKPKNMRKRMLEAIEDVAARMRNEDQLLLILVGHGHNEIGKEGGIEFGSSGRRLLRENDNDHRLLLFGILDRCALGEDGFSWKLYGGGR